MTEQQNPDITSGDEDVEGHRIPGRVFVQPSHDEDDVEGHRTTRPVGSVDEDDVEGHRTTRPVGSVDEDDVEGHRQLSR